MLKLVIIVCLRKLSVFRILLNIVLSLVLMWFRVFLKLKVEGGLFVYIVVCV